MSTRIFVSVSPGSVGRVLKIINEMDRRKIEFKIMATIHLVQLTSHPMCICVVMKPTNALNAAMYIVLDLIIISK